MNKGGQIDSVRENATAAELQSCTPTELSLTLRAGINTALQWLTFLADGKDGPVHAWVFAPGALFVAGRRSKAALEAAAGTASYAQLSHNMAEAIQVVREKVRENAYLNRITGVAQSSDGLLWMTTTPTEFGASLAKFDAARMPTLIHGLAHALHPLHKLGILHLDIHPEMIGFGDDRRPRLRGLGIDERRALPPEAQSNDALGRLGFSAPELWDASGRSALGPWTDVYGAAATCFYWATGRAPADFRARVEDSAGSKEEIAKSLSQALGAQGLGRAGVIDAIVSGLSPRIADRPGDIASWLSIIPPGYWREGNGESGPAASARPASRDADQGKTPRTDAAKVGRRGVPWAMMLLLLLTFAGMMALWTFSTEQTTGSDRDNRESPDANIAANVSSPSAKIVPPVEIPIRRLAGFDYRDDPERLDAVLRTIWGSLPASHSARRYFRAFSSSAGNCATPLRLHLRADGQGLLVARPTGLVWVTEWDRARSREGRIAFSITEVHGEAGRIDVPGLVGSSRMIEARSDTLQVAYLGGEDSSDRENYQACAEGTSPS